MNKINITLALILIPVLNILSGCNKDVLVDLDVPGAATYTNVYMPQSVTSPVNMAISITDQDYVLPYSAYLGGPSPAKSNTSVNFTVPPEMVTAYNQSHSTNYSIMPLGSYTLETPMGTIPSGKNTTGQLKLIIKTKGFLNPFQTYLLPVTLKSQVGGVKVNADLNTTYFLITGAYAPGEVPREKVASLGANAGSFIIDFNGDLMRKDPASGDLLFYKADPVTGLFAAGKKISTGWNAFDKIVFFGSNRLIGRFATGGQNINQYAIDPQGNFLSQREVGQGWGVLAQIVPFKGLLLGILPSGEMTQYPLNAAGDFDYGNIRQIGTGWASFKQLFQYQNSLIAIENNGTMWQYPLSDAGVFGSRTKIGTGWDMYEKVVIAGTDLLAIDKAGDIWRYKFNPVGLWPLKK